MKLSHPKYINICKCNGQGRAPEGFGGWGGVEDVVKSAMGPYFVLCDSFFFLCALASIHHFEKRMVDTQTKNRGPVMHTLGL